MHMNLDSVQNQKRIDITLIIETHFTKSIFLVIFLSKLTTLIILRLMVLLFLLGLQLL